MNINEYTAYFENLATQLKAIGHSPEAPRFKLMNVEDLFGSQRSNLTLKAGPVLILENYDGEIVDNGADQEFNERRCAFHILRECGLNDAVAQQAAAVEAEEIGLKIRRRMNHEANIGEGLANYEPGTARWVYNRVVGLLGSCYGFRFEFTVSDGAMLALDADDWHDLSEG